jgi:hypothetical protein
VAPNASAQQRAPRNPRTISQQQTKARRSVCCSALFDDVLQPAESRPSRQTLIEGGQLTFAVEEQ